MDLNDIIEVILFSGIIFFILGLKAHSFYINHRPRIQRLFFSPKHLKFEGYFSSQPVSQLKKNQ